MRIVDPAISSKPSGLAQTDPPGRFVTGSGKPGGVHEGLGQKNRVIVDLDPVRRQAAQTESQYARRQIGGAGRRRKNEKTLVVRNEAQPAKVLGRNPANKAIPVGTFEGGGSPPQKGHPGGTGESDILERLPDETTNPK